MKLDINKISYDVSPNDFINVPHKEYCNLNIYPEVGIQERIIGLLCDTVNDVIMDNSILIIGWKKGGFIPYNCKKCIKNVFVLPGQGQNINSIPVEFHFNQEKDKMPELVFIENDEIIVEGINPSIIISDSKLSIISDYHYTLTNSSLSVHVNKIYHHIFINAFRYYINTDNTDNAEKQILNYDNLIHLAIMVKNAGPGFEQILINNLHIIDRWTILDTGSTDNTIDIINRVLIGKKKGILYQEPFINFRESRNRLLELCGTVCKFILILDDTYWIKGDLRGFLNEVRGDQIATSFSSLIVTGDSEYYSNRVIKSEEGLRYIYKIHEVIQYENNMNIVIPDSVCKIIDDESEYMLGRTKERKLLDIQLLNEMLEEDPDNPRHLHYLATTYKCLEDWEKTAEYYRRRIDFPNQGFIQEKVDACFELARLYNFTLNRPWSECEALYKQSFDLEPTRPDAFYFIGIHYLHVENDKKTAFEYFKRAIMIGYPIHTQYSLKPTLYYHFLPKYLVPLCYDFNEYLLGEKTCDIFLNSNINDRESEEWRNMSDWKVLFNHINQYMAVLDINKKHKIIYTRKQKLVFIADGGFSSWTGRDILTKGIGGSETYIIEMARYIQAMGTFDVYVFCKCDGEDIFEGVQYKPLAELYNFITTEYISHCIISRFTEYVSPCILCPTIESVYIVLHDTSPSINIIPTTNKICGIFCLTEWHKELFLKTFPQFVGRTHAFGYGIDMTTFNILDITNNDTNKTLESTYTFIYSSFPNRGLLPLLQMWPRILDAIPSATLNIYCNLDNEWVNRVAPEQIAEIRRLLNILPNANITLHGWVSKLELMTAWSNADFWLYPCIFKETYCLTAMEAAASKTLAITNNLAALNETVGDRGIIIPGDPMTAEWQNTTINTLVNTIGDKKKRDKLIEVNYNWATARGWKARAELFTNTFLNKTRPYITLGFRNWLDDTPPGTNIIFEEALKLATKGKDRCKILEIGSYIGTSLIGILDKAGTKSTGTAIDMWEDYNEFGNSEMSEITRRNIEQIFDINLDIAGYTNRVTKIKGDSVKCLTDLIKSNTEICSYDFIYVDGSHTCIDCYTDMVLSWLLLKSTGVMAIDDYMFNIDMLPTKPFSIPYLGVEHFLTKYEGKYTIINKGYRLFLQKL